MLQVGMANVFFGMLMFTVNDTLGRSAVPAVAELLPRLTELVILLLPQNFISLCCNLPFFFSY